MFARQISGFPASLSDQRFYDFGACQLRFRCVDRSGHALVEITIEDDGVEPTAKAQFSFGVEAAAVDQFVESLLEVERATVRMSLSPGPTPSASRGKMIWFRDESVTSAMADFSENLDRILPHATVDREERHSFGSGLGNEHAVEGVAVEGWKGFQFRKVTGANREQANAVFLHLADE